MFLFKKLKSGGIYIIEDLHTSIPEYFETIRYGKNLFGLNDDNTNNTIDFLKTISSKKTFSQYLTSEEIDYISEKVFSVEIFTTKKIDISNQSITSVIIKK